MNAPFQYGTLATRENFIDRVEDRAQLKTFLSSHINVIFVFLRRWGKSTEALAASQVEMQGDKLVFLDPTYRLCFSKKYE